MQTDDDIDRLGHWLARAIELRNEIAAARERLNRLHADFQELLAQHPGRQDIISVLASDVAATVSQDGELAARDHIDCIAREYGPDI
ncbi:MAG: hypothetical protein RML32_15485, partial [Gammaproteobacteria bacterium]|nr:hypothetical protein [Gammaproteobacteria bacterium]